MKGLPLLGANRLTPLAATRCSKWLHSCFVSGGRAHSVRLGASCPLQPLAPRSPSAMALGTGHRRLSRSCGVEPWCRRVRAAATGAAGAHLAPSSDFPPSSLPIARQPLPSCCSRVCWPLCSKVRGQNEALPATAAAARRFCVGSLEVCFCAHVLRAQPPLHGQMLQGMSSFS